MSSQDRVARVLTKLKMVDERLSTTIEVLSDTSMALARASDQRIATDSARPLEGLPFTVKDVIDVAGAKTTGGSNTRKNRAVATRSAEVIQRLVHAGAIPVAKDSTSELAIGDMHTPLKGVCRNPWDLDRWAGGSSSGTAATVATGLVPFGIGTDVNGSIRMPAAFCGVVGLKPTRGVLPNHGIIPMAGSTEVIGPLAKQASTIRRVFSVLAKATAIPHDVSVADRQFRLAVPQDRMFVDCDASVLTGFQNFLTTMRDHGSRTQPVALPAAASASQSARHIVAAEAAYVHCHQSTLWHEYTDFTRERLELGLSISATDYLHAQYESLELRDQLAHILETADAIIMPTVAGAAPRITDAMMTINGQDVETYLHQSRFVSLCSITGFPAISVPTGFDDEGRPVATMLIGSPHSEELLITIAEIYQLHTDHHLAIPPATADLMEA